MERGDRTGTPKSTAYRAFIILFGVCASTGCQGEPLKGNTQGAAKPSDRKDAPPVAKHAEAAPEEATLTPEMIARYGVKIGLVEKRVLREPIVAPARVEFNADATAHVGSSLTGRVSEIRAKVGDVVRKGETLLVLQCAELGVTQGEYLLKKAVAEASAPTVTPARTAYERATSLQETKAISLSEAQKREIEFRSAEANHRAAEAAVIAAESKLRVLGMDDESLRALEKSRTVDPHSKLFAPISGTVVEREATLGELIDPDQEAIFVIADMSTLWVIADVPETKLSAISVGSEAEVFTANASAVGARGKVTYIAPSLDLATRTAQARIEVPGNPPGVRPGMFARAVITPAPRGAETAVLAIPESAVQTIAGKPTVFVTTPSKPNVFAPRTVALGRPAGGVFPVLGGLKEGETIAIEGAFIIKADLGKSSLDPE